MAANRKLGKRTDQRVEMIYSQASQLLWYGKINTTVERAKEVRKVAEKIITLGIRTYKDTVEVTKTMTNQKNEKFEQTFINDGPTKLCARRRMMAVLFDIPEIKGSKESKEAFRKRTKDINHPLIEKIFGVYAPRYAKRAEEKGNGGGYTRIIRTGNRKGDDASVCILELV